MMEIRQSKQVPGLPNKRMSVTYFGGNNSLPLSLKQTKSIPSSTNNQTLSFASTKKNVKTRCRSDLSFRQGMQSIGHCKIDSDTLKDEQRMSKNPQKQFPSSVPSHPFFHKSKYSITHSMKNTLEPYRPRLSNPVIVKSPLQGVLKAKSTHIRKSKLQEYYINLEGERDVCLVLKECEGREDIQLFQGNIQLFHEHHQMKRKLKRRADIKQGQKRSSDVEMHLDHQLSKTKTLQSISCSEPLQNLPQAKPKVKYLFKDREDEKMDGSPKQQVHGHERSLMQSSEKECQTANHCSIDNPYGDDKSNVLRNNLYNSMFLKERINVKRGQMYKRVKKAKGDALFAISQDFDLKPWVNHKLEDKENEMAF